jgi:UPF0176 protein
MSRSLIATFYHFTSLPDFHALRDSCAEQCRDQGIKGTVLLADEGINGTVAGTESAVHAFLEFLRRDPRFVGLKHKESWVEQIPFVRLKVRLKKEIVTLGVAGVDPTERVGTYVNPEEWNDIISEPDVIVIDARNTYETAMGSFAGALDPQLESFGEFPGWLNNQREITAETRIAMFCTGGIRCEKASSFMLQQGFQSVYQLDGGILKYLENIPPQESLWEGECYVFDSRVSVNHQLQPGRFEMCSACGKPIGPEEKESAQYIQGVACPQCYAKTSAEQKSGFAERQRQVELAAERDHSHFAPQSRLIKGVAR